MEPEFGWGEPTPLGGTDYTLESKTRKTENFDLQQRTILSEFLTGCCGGGGGAGPVEPPRPTPGCSTRPRRVAHPGSANLPDTKLATQNRTHFLPMRGQNFAPFSHQGQFHTGRVEICTTEQIRVFTQMRRQNF